MHRGEGVGDSDVSGDVPVSSATVVYDCVGCDYVRYEPLIASMSTQFPRTPQPPNIDGRGAGLAGRVS